MPSVTPTRVLIVAHQTADSRRLVEAVAKRAAAGPCRFTLLIPASFPARAPVTAPAAGSTRRLADPATRWTAEADRRLTAALPRLSEAAGDDVVGVIGAHDPVAAVRDALSLLGFDEVIVSMLPARPSRWLRLDLPRKVRALG
jgi:hypothetical protein